MSATFATATAFPNCCFPPHEPPLGVSNADRFAHRQVSGTLVAFLLAPLRIILTIAALAAASCAPAATDTSSLPPPGTPVFGARGLFGTVSGATGGVAIINPIGSGAPAIMIPNQNGTATIISPGGTGFVIPNRTR